PPPTRSRSPRRGKPSPSPRPPRRGLDLSVSALRSTHLWCLCSPLLSCSACCCFLCRFADPSHGDGPQQAGAPLRRERPQPPGQGGRPHQWPGGFIRQERQGGTIT
uniref:Uncharacterized protein n=1 Tax=Aegilops tauschii subsp. strangulata TaxID=200361 RepID=A0A453Q5S4_AEGTS